MSRVELATNVTEYYRNLGGSGRDVVFLRIAVHGTTRHGIVYGGSYARDSIGNPNYTWYNIPSSTPARQGGLGDDDGVWLNIGFNSDFYGVAYSKVYVCSNGFLCFEPNSVSNTNTPFAIPNNSSTPKAFVAGFWTDLNPAAAQNPQNAVVYYAGNRQTGYIAGIWLPDKPWVDQNGVVHYPVWYQGCKLMEHIFVVQWNAVPIKSTGTTITFQVILARSYLIQDNGTTIEYPNYQGFEHRIYINYLRSQDWDPIINSHGVVGVEDQLGVKGTAWDQVQYPLWIYPSIIFSNNEMQCPASMRIRLTKTGNDQTASMDFVPSWSGGLNIAPKINITTHQIIYQSVQTESIYGYLFDWAGVAISAVLTFVPVLGELTWVGYAGFGIGMGWTVGTELLSPFLQQTTWIAETYTIQQTVYQTFTSCLLTQSEAVFFSPCAQEQSEISSGQPFTDTYAMIYAMWSFPENDPNSHGLKVTADFNYLQSAMDSDTHTVSTSVDLIAYDNMAPTIGNQGSVSYIANSILSHSVAWNVFASDPDTYTMTYHSASSQGPWQLVKQGTWQSGTLACDVSRLPQGSYTYNCTVRDKGGHTASNCVNVNVLPPDLTKPVITGPSTITYPAGTTSSITWNVGDAHPYTYKIQCGSNILQSGTWTNGSLTQPLASDLLPGTYQYACTVTDEAGNSNDNTVTVTVTTNLRIDSPPDTKCPVGPVTFYVDWHVTGIGGTYEIRRGGTLLYTSTWSGTGTISVNVGGCIRPTTIDWTCTVKDTSGNTVSDTVRVTYTQYGPI
jgi:hypothetical protein